LILLGFTPTSISFTVKRLVPGNIRVTSFGGNQPN